MSRTDFEKVLYDSLVRIEEKCDTLGSRLADVEKKQAVAEERQKVHVDHMEATASQIRKISNILQEQADDVREHIRRSDLLESNQEEFKKSLEAIVTRIEPLEEDQKVETIIKKYQKEQRQELSNTLKDWRTITAIVVAIASFVGGKLMGWF